MAPINSPSGPNSAYNAWTPSAENPEATVQVGETKLPDVAQRLGVDLDSLAKANPQISDPANLKPGQEIRLPQVQTLQVAETDPALGSTDQSGLPPAPLGDPLASTVAHGLLMDSDRAAPNYSGGPTVATTTTPDSIASVETPALTVADLHSLAPETGDAAADPAANHTLQLCGWTATISADDTKTASRMVGTIDGATSLLQSLLAPYFGIKSGSEIRENADASSKARADAIQAMQNDMLLMSVRMAKTVFPGFRPLNLNGEETIKSDSKRWKEETSQKIDEFLKRAMAAARMMQSQLHAKGHVGELGARLSGLVNQATVDLANTLARDHHDPKNQLVRAA